MPCIVGSLELATVFYTWNSRTGSLGMVQSINQRDSAYIHLI
jgi:hypothetical protein